MVSAGAARQVVQVNKQETISNRQVGAEGWLEANKLLIGNKPHKRVVLRRTRA